MNPPKIDLSSPTSWKHYLLVAGKFLAIFYFATLGMVLFFIYKPESWIIPGMFLGLLYLFILIYSFKQMLKKLPMAAIMLAAPTVPLFILLLILSFIPIVQVLT